MNTCHLLLLAFSSSLPLNQQKKANGALYSVPLNIKKKKKNGISTFISSQIENGANTHISHIPLIFSFHPSLVCNMKIFTF